MQIGHFMSMYTLGQACFTQHDPDCTSAEDSHHRTVVAKQTSYKSEGILSHGALSFHSEAW